MLQNKCVPVAEQRGAHQSHFLGLRELKISNSEMEVSELGVFFAASGGGRGSVEGGFGLGKKPGGGHSAYSALGRGGEGQSVPTFVRSHQPR